MPIHRGSTIVQEDAVSQMQIIYGQSLENLPAQDEAALLVILSGFVYMAVTGRPTTMNVASSFIPEDWDDTTDEINTVLSLLEGIDANQATRLIQIIAQ